MFLIQTPVLDPLRSFSKYTPANPLLKHAKRTAKRPISFSLNVLSEAVFALSEGHLK